MSTIDAHRYCLFATDFGPVGVAWSERGLTYLQLPEADTAATEARLSRRAGSSQRATPPSPVAQAIVLLERYFAGERVDFADVDLDLTGVAPFYREIYAAARLIGWGETATYGDLARQIGSPGAARGVGQAMSRNPVAVIIPCHRILASGNKVGGFSAFGGAASKQRLLALEGVRLGRASDTRQLQLFEQW
jgi:methylated-DNA-[protein]-cysteine S-methyltransferase